jgi:phosphoribosylaminoimidazole-succinocarboxamide synthase
VDETPTDESAGDDTALFDHLHSGKVRDLYRTPEGLLLLVASDRMSAYDHILPTPIPDKGRILTAMSWWWFGRLKDLVPNHAIAVDDVRIPARWRGRATLCRPLDMIPVEAVARGYLTGSGLKDYNATGSVCGVAIPPGLIDGDRLPEPIFTPAAKAQLGSHDENISFADVAMLVGEETATELRKLTLAVYSRAADIAAGRGIILADTKLEFGYGSRGIVLGDEVLTPDSSRFWPALEWRPGQPQSSYDKQYVRDWLTSSASGWDGVGAPPPLPDDVVAATRARYIEAYERLTGLSFADWLRPPR